MSWPGIFGNTHVTTQDVAQGITGGFLVGSTTPLANDVHWTRNDYTSKINHVPLVTFSDITQLQHMTRQQMDDYACLLRFSLYGPYNNEADACFDPSPPPLTLLWGAPIGIGNPSGTNYYVSDICSVNLGFTETGFYKSSATNDYYRFQFGSLQEGPISCTTVTTTTTTLAPVIREPLTVWYNANFSSQACDDATSGFIFPITVWAEGGTTLSTASFLFENDTGPTVVQNGWYSDGIVAVLTSSGQITQLVDCT